MTRFTLAATGLAAIIAAASAQAADLPIKAPPRAAIVTDPGGFYLWADGSYQAISLPRYGLGLAYNSGAALIYGGQIDSFDPRLDGGGASGAIGYRLPDSPFGSNFRVEVGGSYLQAEANQSTGTGPFTVPFQQSLQMLAGGFAVAAACATFCTTNATLATTYTAWQVNGKLATDLTTGPYTLTPWVSLFGGNSRDDQAFRQFYDNHNIFGSTLTYVANTHLRWSDWGGRLGLDAQVDLANAFAIGVTGSVAFADRRTDLSGSDEVIGSVVGLFNRSAIALAATRTAFLANAEVNLGYRPTRNVRLKAFAGLNYDDSVPGILAPSFAGSWTAAAPTTPASITYAAETSYYAGGGVTVAFAP